MRNEELEWVAARLSGLGAHELTALLSEYSSRWRFYSGLIWSTASIFLPLSLSGIALGIDDAPRTLVIAGFSMMLIWTWFWLSNTLRRLVYRQWEAYLSIERELTTSEEGSHPNLRGLDRLGPNDAVSPYGSLSVIRIAIPFFVSAGWLVASVAALLLASD